MAQQTPIYGRTTYQNQFTWGSSTTKLNFVMGLQSNRGHRDRNLLRKYGLIGNAAPGQDFDYAIGKMLLEKGSTKYYIHVHKQGAPIFGADMPLRDDSTVRDRPFDTLASVNINMPGELIGTRWASAISHMPVYYDTMATLRDYLDQLEFELCLVVASGIRGSSKAWEVFNIPQPDIDVPLEQIAPNWAVYKQTIPIDPPTNHLCSNQTREQMVDDAAVNHSTYAQPGLQFDTIKDIHHYLTTRNRQEQGFGIGIPRLNFPKEYVQQRARNPQNDQYVMFVSSELGNTITKSQDWISHQEALIQKYGLKNGIVTGYLGQINNILLVENMFIPQFETETTATEDGADSDEDTPGVQNAVGGKGHWCRALIFGAQSLVYGYYNHEIPFKFRTAQGAGSHRTINFKTPWRFRVEPLNKSTNSEILADAMGGFKRVNFPVPEALIPFDGTVEDNLSQPYAGNAKTPWGAQNPGYRTSLRNSNGRLLRRDRGMVVVDILERVGA